MKGQQICDCYGKEGTRTLTTDSLAIVSFAPSTAGSTINCRILHVHVPDYPTVLSYWMSDVLRRNVRRTYGNKSYWCWRRHCCCQANLYLQKVLIIVIVEPDKTCCIGCQHEQGKLSRACVRPWPSFHFQCQRHCSLSVDGKQKLAQPGYWQVCCQIRHFFHLKYCY